MVVKINWNPNEKEIFNFGVVLFCGLAVTAVFCFFKHKQTATLLLLIVSVFIFVLSWLAPNMAKPFYWAWMVIGFVMSSVVSRIMLILIYCVVITPMALFFKVRGRDSLGLKKKNEANATYWIPLKEINDKTYYDHLF